jgi:hypothetical protein
MRPGRPPSASPLAAGRLFSIPQSLLAATIETVAAARRRGEEAFVVWGATVEQDGHEVAFRSALVPAQTAHKTPSGLLVTVDGQALFEVNRTLYATGQILAAQVHAHPTDAYHSDTDDCFSLVTLTGALSIVVPDFARAGLSDLSRWAWYRLTGASEWAELTRADKVQLVADRPAADAGTDTNDPTGGIR